MKFFVQILIWGKDFIDFFSEFSLPSQLVGNNLDYLSQKADVTYWFFTFRESRKYLEQTESFQRLKKMASIKITEIDSFSLKCKYKIWQKCIQIIAEEGIKENCPVIYLYPDGVYSHRVMEKIYKAIIKGKRALVYPSFRVRKETMLPELQKFPSFKTKGITAQELLEKAFKHLHNEMKSCFWDPKKITEHPSRLIWQLDDSVYLYKCFHIHPFCIWAEKNVLPTSSIDVSYVYDAVSIENIEIVKDASEIAVVDFAPAFPVTFMKNSHYNIGNWLRKNTTENSRKIFCYDFYFSLKPFRKEQYKAKLSEIKELEKQVLSKVNIFFICIYEITQVLKKFIRLFITTNQRKQLKKFLYSKK